MPIEFVMPQLAAGPVRAFAHRDFRLFWLAQLVSLCGTWMQSLGQAWLVLELTSSPFRLGLISTLQFGPFLVLSFVAGVVVDRLPKRQLLIATQTALLVQAGVLSALVSTGHVRYWHVAVLALAAGVANTFDMPARQSFVVDMVGKEDLLNAIALNSAAFNAARVVGPALAGLLIARWGVAAAFAINAASFLAPIIALSSIATEGRTRVERRPLGAEIAEAFVYASRTPRVLLVLALLLGVSLFVFNYNVVVPLLARDVLREEAHGLGFLMAALGAGALIGAVGLAMLSRARPRSGTIVTAAVVLSLATLAMGFVRHFWVAAAILFVMGTSGILFMTSCNTTLQLGVPDALRGRMMALYTLVFVGVTPIGSFVIGTIAEHAGVPLAFRVGGLASLVSVVAVTIWWLRSRRSRHTPPADTHVLGD
jgi:MFS family permease